MMSQPEPRPADPLPFADASEADAAAERAWQLLLANLPEERPSAGFAARVMARVRSEAPAVAALSRPLPRFALVAAICAGGLVVSAAARLLPWIWALTAELDPRRLLASAIAGSAEGVANAVTKASGWLDAWSTLGEVANRLLLRPDTAIAASLALVLSAAALRWLDRLLVGDRSPSHV
jgi:hypothetical protein